MCLKYFLVDHLKRLEATLQHVGYVGSCFANCGVCLGDVEGC